MAFGPTISRCRTAERLGGDGIGFSHTAGDTKLKRWAALKLLEARLLSSSEAKARFLRDAQAAAALHHANAGGT